MKKCAKAMGLACIMLAGLMERGYERRSWALFAVGLILSAFCYYHDWIVSRREENARRSKVFRTHWDG